MTRGISLAAVLLAGFASTAASQTPRADRARLRADVVRLRAEVEMLALDYDIERADLLDDLKTRKGMEMLGGFISAGNALQAAVNDANANRPPAPGTAPVARDKADAEQAAAREKAKFLADRRAALAILAATLAGRRLDLEDAERDYRSAATAIVSTPAKATATLEHGPDIGIVRTGGTPIVDLGGECPLDPPSEAEVAAQVPLFEADPALRARSRFAIEKIGQQADDCKVYPLAGRCRLVHCHYKCTVSFDEKPHDGAPKRGEVVVFIDKDYLMRCDPPAPTPGRVEVK